MTGFSLLMIFSFSLSFLFRCLLLTETMVFAVSFKSRFPPDSKWSHYFPRRSSATFTETISRRAVGDVLAHIVGLDGQLRMASVDEGEKLDFRRTTRAITASIAARAVRPVKMTSSTSSTVLPSTEKGTWVPLTTGISAMVLRSVPI